MSTATAILPPFAFFLLCPCRVNFPTTTILCSGVKKMPGRKEIIDKYPLTVTKTTLLLGGERLDCLAG